MIALVRNTGRLATSGSVTPGVVVAAGAPEVQLVEFDQQSGEYKKAKQVVVHHPDRPYLDITDRHRYFVEAKVPLGDIGSLVAHVDGYDACRQPSDKSSDSILTFVESSDRYALYRSDSGSHFEFIDFYTSPSTSLSEIPNPVRIDEHGFGSALLEIGDSTFDADLKPIVDIQFVDASGLPLRSIPMVPAPFLSQLVDEARYSSNVNPLKSVRRFVSANCFKVRVVDRARTSPMQLQLRALSAGGVVDSAMVQFGGGYPNESSRMFLAYTGVIDENVRQFFAPEVVLIDPDDASELEISLSPEISKKAYGNYAHEQPPGFTRKMYVTLGDPDLLEITYSAVIDKRNYLEDLKVTPIEAPRGALEVVDLGTESSTPHPDNPDMKVSSRTIKLRLLKKGTVQVDFKWKVLEELPYTYLDENNQPVGPPKKRYQSYVFDSVEIVISDNAWRSFNADERAQGGEPHNPGGLDLARPEKRKEWVFNVLNWRMDDEEKDITYELNSNENWHWSHSSGSDIGNRIVHIGTSDLYVQGQEQLGLSKVLTAMLHESVEVQSSFDCRPLYGTHGNIFNPGIDDVALANELHFMDKTGMPLGIWVFETSPHERDFLDDQNKGLVLELLDAYRNGVAHQVTLRAYVSSRDEYKTFDVDVPALPSE